MSTSSSATFSRRALFADDFAHFAYFIVALVGSGGCEAHSCRYIK
jgi:hypothetical protein